MDSFTQVGSQCGITVAIMFEMSCEWLKALLVFVFYSQPSSHNNLIRKIWYTSPSLPLILDAVMSLYFENELPSPPERRHAHISTFQFLTWIRMDDVHLYILTPKGQDLGPVCCDTTWMFWGNPLCCVTIKWIKYSASIQVQRVNAYFSLTFPLFMHTVT